MAVIDGNPFHISSWENN